MIEIRKRKYSYALFIDGKFYAKGPILVIFRIACKKAGWKIPNENLKRIQR